MSGFFGLYNRNSVPLADNSDKYMLDAISYWQPDTNGTWKSKYVALGHSMLWNSPQSKHEHLPCRYKNLVLTMDARLDGRQELIEKLGLSNHYLDTITDSELIVKAYEKWSEECPKHLLGDFAFALWDTKKQQFFCARDHIGIKQFYFHLTRSFFIFSNDLKALAEYPTIPLTINDDSIADYLINFQLLNVKNTFFQAINKLPPSHSLTINAITAETNCFWHPTEKQKFKHYTKSATHAVKELRHLLELAVEDRLRSSYPVSSHLSGGLDSGAIAVIAARKLKKRQEKLLAFNWQEKPLRKADLNSYEWANSKKIAKPENITHNYVSITENDIFKYTKDHTLAHGHSSTFWFEFAVREAVQENKSRTILTGWGGDEVASYHGQAFHTDLFYKMKLGIVFKELLLKVKKSEKNIFIVSLSHFYHHMLLPFVPKFLFNYMPKNGQKSFPKFIFVKPSFLPTIEQKWSKQTPLSSPPKRSIRSHILAYLRHGHLQSRIESWATAATAKKIEYSYPLLDKRIVEFILELPAEYFIHNGLRRYLFRSAVKGLLPEDIIWADTKMEPRRVKRLLHHKLAVCKKILKNKKSNLNKSSYINEAKLKEYAINFNDREINEKSLMMIVNIEASLLIIQSFTLQ